MSLSSVARVIGVLLISAVALLPALLGWKSFVTTFSNFLDVLLFVFVPWSVINLVDFCLVQHERYDVASFYTARGQYGGWRWAAVIPDLVAVGAELLFVDQTDLKGPLVNALGGADISWIVGGVVAAVGYQGAGDPAGGVQGLTRGTPGGHRLCGGLPTGCRRLFTPSRARCWRSPRPVRVSLRRSRSHRRRHPSRRISRAAPPITIGAPATSIICATTAG